tara:strand:+ start:1936 stop:3327 length:1392 start_codon:yes stop_codon:yes gene_type:complete
MGQNFSSTAGSNPGAVNGEQTTAPGNSQPLQYLSICSGIEAASVAWEPLGWQAVAFAEIDKFPSAVLKHHWPDVPNLGDMSNFKEWPESVFLKAACIVAGTPCQAFSVAGQRRSLEDERGNLTLTFTRIIDHARTIRVQAGRPEAVILWENVPGCLSTKDNAFGCFLSEISGNDLTAIKKWPTAGRVLGKKRRVAWRIIDAQFCGVPQRRRRVFVVAVNTEAVADSRAASPEQILSLGQSLRGDIKKSKKERKEVTWTLGSRSKAGGGFITDFECAGGLQPIDVTESHWPQDLAPTLNAAFGDKLGLENQHIDGGAGHFVQDDCICLSSDQAGAAVTKNKAASLTCNQGATPIVKTLAPAVACSIAENQRGELREGAVVTNINNGGGKPGQGYPAIRIAQAVRRLTPVECERLQGFPDNHTRIPWRNKPAENCPDGARYKALGNSMAVPVIRWIGERIERALA